MKREALIVLMLSAGCNVIVQAAENLGPIVVTATRTEESIGSIAGKVQVIEREELAQQLQTGENLTGALGRLIPNLGAGTETASGATQTIRGRKPLYLIDGVPQTDNRNVSRLLDSVSPLAIERIEVVTGASAIYGVGGSGGVINIITRSAAKAPEGTQFSTSIGTNLSTTEFDSDAAAFEIGQTLSYKKQAFDAFAAVQLRKTNGLYDADGDRIAPEPAQTSVHDSDTSAALVKLGWQLSDQKRLQLSFDHLKREQDSDYGPNYGGPGVPALLGLPTEVIAVKGLSLDDQPSTKRNAITLGYQDGGFLGSQLNSQLYYREREYRFFPFAFALAGSNFVNQSTTEADVYGGKFLLDTPLNDKTNIVYGLDYQVDKGKQSAVGHHVLTFAASGGLVYTPVDSYAFGPDVDTKTLGLFSDIKYQLNDKLLLRGGIRHEDISQKIHDYLPTYEHLLVPTPFRTTIAGQTKDYSETLFNLGTVYSLTSEQQLFVNYSQGFELPDLARLLRDSIAPNSLLAGALGVPGTVIDNINLDAIKVSSYELGWRGDWESVNANVTAFYNESDKTVRFNPDFSVTQDDQEKKIYGLEASLDYYADQFWSLGVSGAYTVGKTEDQQTGRSLHLDAIDVSPPKLLTHITYGFDSGSSVRLQATQLFDYDKAEQNVNGSIVADAEIDGYYTIDLLSRWHLPVGELAVNITNLTNRDYQTVYSQWAQDTFGPLSGVPAQGRAIGLSYWVSY